MECRIKVLYFFIYDNNRVKLYWLGQSPCPDKIGDVPVIVIRLREDYVPRNTVESRLSWKACFHILRMRFGAQFCFTFQIGKRGIQNWCFPRILWVPGVDSDLNKLCPVNPWDPEQMQSWINAQYSRPVRLEGRGGKKSAYTLPMAILPLTDTTTASRENHGYVLPDERVFHAPVTQNPISSDEEDVIESIEPQSGATKPQEANEAH
ncbi:hypothetical protein F4823DRAFT_561078 [Ustulina deusta]|nr:hypothetical protein F4823DRAFT_561078 [Ustulina deusta]